MKPHPGTLLAGLIYLTVGVTFILEALGYWALRLSDLRYVGPLALVVVGITVVVGSMRSTPPEPTQH